MSSQAKSSIQNNPMRSSYNTISVYQNNIPLVFPDLTLTFKGKRHVSHPTFKTGFEFYDFEIKTVNESKTISWSPGTGEISPVYFEIGNKRFKMELLFSEKYGQIKSGSLVLVKK